MILSFNKIKICLVISIFSYLHSNKPSRVLTLKVIKFEDAIRGKGIPPAQFNKPHLASLDTNFRFDSKKKNNETYLSKQGIYLYRRES
jgi:hypothetical protein